MMALTEAMGAGTRPMTEDEFLRLPHDGKYELVDGEAVKVPASYRHDAIGGNLIALLRPHARGRGFITSSQAGFRMRSGNIRCPDAAFTLKERLPGGRPPAEFPDCAPDLAVEIISPSEDRADMARKVEEYFDAGAREVWQLIPETQQLKRFRSPEDQTLLEATDAVDGGELLPGFRCRVAEPFDFD